MKELILRFLIGGTLVSVFALVGDLLRPKSFAGLFGPRPPLRWRVSGWRLSQRARIMLR
jgi:hypothetical protein